MRRQAILLALYLLAALVLSVAMLAFGLTQVVAAADAGSVLLALSGAIQLGIGVYVGSVLVRAICVGLRARRPGGPGGGSATDAS